MNVSGELLRRQMPRYGLGAEGVAEQHIGGSARQRGDTDPTVTDANRGVRSWRPAQLPGDELRQFGVALEHDVGRAGAGGPDEAGHGEPAAAEVHCMNRSRRQRVECSSEQLGVRELEVGRVVEVDVAVLEVVELKDPSARTSRVGEHRGAEVGALDIASRVRRHVRSEGTGTDHGKAGRAEASRSLGGVAPSMTSYACGEDDAEHHERAPDKARDG